MTLTTMTLVLSACSKTPPQADPAMDVFATCTNENGLKMYGTERCPHCKDQKAKFWPSFDKVDYIDCDKQKQQCLVAGIEGYPTWTTKAGEKLVGTQELSVLATKSGCELPGAVLEE